MGSRTSGKAGIACRCEARRRGWLRAAVAHCSALAFAGWLAAPVAVHAQGASAATANARTPPANAKTLLVVGDSLSAEYGIARGTGWVALLDKRLAAERLPWRVVNASVSGDTTSGGRSRLPALLREHKPQVVIIELGGNDALRGLPLSMTEANLAEMTRQSKAASARVLLVGMAVPPNYGRAYGESFMAVFPKVARAEGAALVPFLLAGIAEGPLAEAMFQPDRIHPRAEAHPRLLDNVWSTLRPLLR
ncbi:MAG: arylesterase [Betaproteobacteria bacterium]|nr:arylesterase [Betaproteobacteria bacterium]MCC6249400.1 arylesterase [Rubrivivax sp.]